MATFTVKGKVTDQNNKPQAGLIVRASDLDFKGENALGRPVRTNEHGQYEIEYDSKDFVIEGRETTAADVLVRVFDTNGLLLAKSVLLRGSEQSPEQQAGKAPVEINLVIGTNSDTESSHVVRGTVRVDGTPTKNIMVSTYDQDLPSKNSDQLLGQCRTDEFGHYYIPYILKSARKAERGSADVYVKVADKDPRFEAAKSATVFNAGSETLIDLDLKGKVTEDNTAEYDRYLTQLSPVLDGAPIHVLTPEDLSFLANETGIAAEHLAYLRWSHLWAVASQKVKAYTFYAFLREGFASDMAYWIDKKQGDYKTAMESALKNNIIADGSFKVEDVMDFVAQKSLQSSDDVTKTPLQIVLNTVIRGQTAVQLAADYIRHEPQNGDFWEIAKDNKVYGEAIPKIKFGFDALDLTLQNETLTQALLSENITDTRALVDKNHEDWVQLMTPDTTKRSAKGAFTFPDSIKGETDEEKRKNYADTIMAGLEQKHPAEFVVKDLKRPVRYSGKKIWDTIKEESRKEDFDILEFDTDQVEDPEAKKQIIALQNEVRIYPKFAETINNSGYWTEEKVTEVPENTIKTGVKTFFEESGYDLKKPVGIYFDEIQKTRGNDPLSDKAYAEEIKAAVEQRYRVQLIARNAEQAGKLLEGRVFSPMDVVNLSPSTKKRLNEAGLKDQEIDEIKDKATEVVTTAHYLASELYIHFNHTNPMVMGNNRETLKLTQTQVQSNARGTGAPEYDVVSATYEALFGSTSTCACEHCLSVYGAAAYFVDFLHTLLKEGEAGSPGQKLLARRPDLQYIKLNCENTNTRVPYIDLVNEIFEIYIAHNNLGQEDKVRNSIKKAADIAKEPEYLISEAYAELNNVVYPLNLPFDRDYVSTDVYLETAGTSRFEVLQWVGEPDEEQLVRAILGLSPSEYELFTNPYEKFYRLLENIKPEALENYRQQLSELEIRKGNFADFLTDLDSSTQIVLSNQPSLRPFYERIKYFTLTDEEWGIFKSVFLEVERKIYAPSHLFGLDKIDKLYYNTTALSSTNISQVSTFMERTGLSMEELIKILKVKSVLSPFTKDGELLYKVLDGPNSDSCNIDHLYLRYKDSESEEQAVDDFTFVRICRFIRLWKKLNCGIEILDRLLQALYKGRRRAVKDEFNGKISYFDVFEPGVLTQLAYAVALQKQLNWSLEKITLLFEEEVAAIPETEKNIRKAELAKKMNLGMDWADFVAFAAEDKKFSPKQVYQLLQWHQTIRQADFQAKEMRYLLHNAPISEKDRLTDQEVLQFTKKLRDGIRKVATDTAAQAELTADFILDKLKLVYEDTATLQLWSDLLRGEIRTTVGLKLEAGELFPAAIDERLKYSTQQLTINGFVNLPILEELKVKFDDNRKNELEVSNAFYAKIGQAINAITPTRTADLTLEPGEEFPIDLDERLTYGEGKIHLSVEPTTEILQDLINKLNEYKNETNDKRNKLYSKINTAFDGILHRVSAIGFELASSEVFPEELIDQLTYSEASRELTLKPSDFDERDILSILNNLDTIFTSEQNKDQAQRRNIPYSRIKTALFEFLSGDFLTQSIQKILASQPPFFTAEDKVFLYQRFLGNNFSKVETLKFILDALYNYLTEAFLVQTISSEFKLEVATAKLLVDKIHDEWQKELKKYFIDNLPLSTGKYWITPPKTEEYVFHTISSTGSSTALILDWENQDKNNPLLAGKFYKTKVEITPLTLQWEARTHKVAIIDEQYLFADSIVDSIKTKMQQFDKFALLVNKFKLSSAELEWMLEHQADFGNIPLQFDSAVAFTYAHWLRLANYTALKKALNDEDGQDLLELFRLADLDSQDLRNYMLYLTQWKATDLTGRIDSANFKNEIYLSELLRKKQFRDKYGFELTSDLSFDTVKQGILSRYTDEARDTLQKKAEDRLRSLRRNALMGYLLEYKKPVSEVLKKAIIKGRVVEMGGSLGTLTQYPLSNVNIWVGNAPVKTTDIEGKFEIEIAPGRYSVRAQMIGFDINSQIIDLASGQELSLGDIVLREPSGQPAPSPVIVHQPLEPFKYEWKNINDLYAYFLIDVEMEPNVSTSRIVQANATLQLFAQRVLMNLEQEVKPEKINATWYEWMHKYRVWEANRKVFLYPENWIEPELRDDKSEIFKALESELLQREVTQENAMKALGTYLYALDEVARLDVRAFCEDPESGELHVVARTFTVPHIYYYRKRKKDMVWTPWEKMDVGIEGDNISINLLFNNLVIFWFTSIDKTKKVKKIETDYDTPMFELKKTENGNSELIYNKTETKEISFKKITLNWSIRKNNEWKKPITSSKDIQVFEKLERLQRYAYVRKVEDDYVIGLMNCDFSQQGTGEIVVEYSGRFIMNNQTNVFNSNSEVSLIEDGDRQVRRIDIWKINYFNPNIPSNQYNSMIRDLAGSQKRKIYFSPNVIDRITNIFKFLTITEDNSSFFLKRGEKLFIKDQDNSNSYFINNIFNAPSILFSIFYHPYTKKLLVDYNKGNFLKKEHQLLNLNQDYFKLKYKPKESIEIPIRAEGYDDPRSSRELRRNNNQERYVKYLVDSTGTEEIIDFSVNGTYSSYNWELFFHIPLLIANRLSQNQRYQEAQQWYHYIFNPTTAEAPPADGHGGVSRFWQFLPFRQAVAEGKESIVDILKKLYTEDPKAPGSTSNQIDTWRNDPFNPHAIARKRIQAYMRNVVGKYIDNLIQWGDMLFRQDSMESINEATQLYILAANILGPRPVRVPSSRTAERFHYAELKGKGIDKFGNVLLNFIPNQTNNGRANDPAAQLKAAQFYFCIPDNAFILKYWDTVADRLFKIRHGQNIEGIERQLDLFEPEIDPALLVRARAMGMDIGSILRDLQAPLPHYRFNVMLQKALEMCAELRGLGGSLLSAIEKKEAEALAMIRQKHEVQMLNLVTEIKRGSVQEAQENLNGLNLSLESANKRYEYYSKKERVNFKERQALNFTQAAHGYESMAQGFSTIATVAFAVPQFHAQGTATGSSTGGEQAGRVLQAYASIYNALASQLTFASNMAKTDADYDRRKEDWDFQKDLAQIEQRQLARQILAAEIRKNIAQRDLDNHLQQIENARQIEDFLRSKFSNQELYSWMEREIKTLYNQCYQMVYDYAKRAEKTYRYELGVENSDFIRFGAWDSNRNGLLAGEKLYVGLKQLEKAYMDQNRRELEITKHISLNQLDPLALLYLREQGKCDFAIPEELFDLDFPGHYMRRIKSVSITIPCVAGPYTSINATLRLKKSSTRVKASAGNGYPRVEGDDDRFRDQFTGIQSIATSSAQNDSGLFELNFRDERYLPFEGAGAINSEWTLEMMSDPTLRQFDYNTISDVVLHMRYTAREDGGLKTAAITNLKGLTDKLGKESLARLFSLRHDFPNEWHAWTKQNQALSIKLQKHHFPYFAQMGSITIKETNAFPFKEKKIALDAPDKKTAEPNALLGEAGWVFDGAGLTNDKDDYFLIIHYTI